MMNCPPQHRYDFESSCRKEAIKALKRVNYYLKVSNVRVSNWVKYRVDYAISYFHLNQYALCLSELHEAFIPADQYSSDIIWDKKVKSLTRQQLSRGIESLCLIK